MSKEKFLEPTGTPRAQPNRTNTSEITAIALTTTIGPSFSRTTVASFSSRQKVPKVS